MKKLLSALLVAMANVADTIKLYNKAEVILQSHTDYYMDLLGTGQPSTASCIIQQDLITHCKALHRKLTQDIIGMQNIQTELATYSPNDEDSI